MKRKVLPEGFHSRGLLSRFEPINASTDPGTGGGEAVRDAPSGPLPDHWSSRVLARPRRRERSRWRHPTPKINRKRLLGTHNV